MKNMNIFLPLVNGSSCDLDYDSGEELISELITDDWGAPPQCLVIEAKTDDGKKVTITIPNSSSDKAAVKIEENS